MLDDWLKHRAIASDRAGMARVHAAARAFYARGGFVPSPVDDAHLQLTLS